MILVKTSDLRLRQNARRLGTKTYFHRIYEDFNNWNEVRVNEHTHRLFSSPSIERMKWCIQSQLLIMIPQIFPPCSSHPASNSKLAKNTRSFIATLRDLFNPPVWKEISRIRHDIDLPCVENVSIWLPGSWKWKSQKDWCRDWIQNSGSHVQRSERLASILFNHKTTISRWSTTTDIYGQRC